MAEISLVAEPGRATGSSESKRIRRTGRIPAVVYGHGIDALAVSVDARDFRHALSGDAGLNQLLSLEVDGRSHLTLARVLQRHPVRNTVIHVDFQVVRRDEIVAADVPVVLVGEAKAVEAERGIIEQPLTTLTVNANPGNIPNELTYDISALEVGVTIRVGDLTLPNGVTTDVDPEEPVIVAATSTLEGEVAEIEEAEAIAVAEAVAEAGEAPAEDADADGDEAASEES
jgi:large subunit ribosomal protein L25